VEVWSLRWKCGYFGGGMVIYVEVWVFGGGVVIVEEVWSFWWGCGHFGGGVVI
jgi:hypothetical protein